MEGRRKKYKFALFATSLLIATIFGGRSCAHATSLAHLDNVDDEFRLAETETGLEAGKEWKLNMNYWPPDRTTDLSGGVIRAKLILD